MVIAVLRNSCITGFRVFAAEYLFVGNDSVSFKLDFGEINAGSTTR